MRRRITKRTADAFTASDGSAAFLWDTELKGFGLKVTPAGKRVFILQHRLAGQRREAPHKRLTLGAYGEITVEEARTRARGFLLQITDGADPRPPRGRPAEVQAGQPTVGDLAKRFLEEYLPEKKRPPRKSTIAFYAGLFSCHIVPRLQERTVESITAGDVERLHSSMRATPYVANRTLSLLQHAFDQAERWGWRPQRSNPALHIDRFPEERRGARKEVMLTPAQMATLLRAVDEAKESGVDPIACSAILFAFWTGWRISEVLHIEWANVDLDRGVAKLLYTKTAAEEYRHVPEEALAILEALPCIDGSCFVFPGEDPKRHLTTVRKPWAKIRQQAGLTELPVLGPLRLHDLRHNVVSWDVSRGVALEIAGRNVGHRSRRSTEVYAHFAPDALKRAADARAEAMRQAVDGVRPA
jgi:integrase